MTTELIQMSTTTSLQKNILFVDDDELILGSYRRSFRSKKNWNLFYAINGKEALRVIEQYDISVVVSDMLMPTMTGHELFIELKKSYPHITRIMLSAHISQNTEEIKKVISNAHVFLSKPCDHKELISHISKHLSLQAFIDDDRIKLTLTKIDKLPSLEKNHLELMEILEDPDCEMSDIVQILEQDLSMTSKILQLVNSSFFYTNKKIISVEHSVKLLGLEAIKHFALVAKIFDVLSCDKRFYKKINELWAEGLYCMRLVKQIGSLEKMDSELINTASLAAMLHDTGQLIFYSSYFGDYPEIQNLIIEEGVDICQAEREVSGVTHSQLGAYFLGLWGLPEEITHAVFIHHDLDVQDFSHFNPGMLVYLANFFWHLVKKTEIENSPGFIELKQQVNIGNPNRFEQWFEVAKGEIIDGDN